ncbi:hypothetical protein BZK37_12045 [Enterococcus casseliflavus]|nr:hypothetical protein BZK37_12045 [Enterococcus casseliflavus]
MIEVNPRKVLNEATRLLAIPAAGWKRPVDRSDFFHRPFFEKNRKKQVIQWSAIKRRSLMMVRIFKDFSVNPMDERFKKRLKRH